MVLCGDVIENPFLILKARGLMASFSWWILKCIKTFVWTLSVIRRIFNTSKIILKRIFKIQHIGKYFQFYSNLCHVDFLRGEIRF